MNKLLILLFILFAVPLFSQTPEESYWGTNRLIFGNLFWDADSIDLKISGMTDSLFNDTLFTDALPVKESEGYFGVSAYYDSLQGAADTLQLSIRLGVKSIPRKTQKDALGNSYRPRAKIIRWYAWHELMGMMHKDSLYSVQITGADCTWWDPTANILQFRTYENQGDSVLHDINQFRDVK